MLNHAVRMLVMVLLAMMTAACELVGDIFQAGMWIGVILVVIGLGLVMWILGMVRGRTRSHE